MDYCCSSWYSGLSSNLKLRLEALQRKMVRFIHSMEPRQHVDNAHLRNLSWLSVSDRVLYFKMMHIFRIRNDLAPAYLRSNFVSLELVHSHNTRGSDFNYRLSHVMSLAHLSFAFTASKQWNSLPDSLKSISQYHSFKRKLKDFFLSQYEWLRHLNLILTRNYWFYLSNFITSSYFVVMGTLLETRPSLGQQLRKVVNFLEFSWIY